MADEGQDELPDRSLDVIGGVAEFEEALWKHRDFIVKILNVKNILDGPISFKDIISEDEQGSIRLFYESNRMEKAATMFIDAILSSKDETKWSVFKDALEWSDGLELIKEILCKGKNNALKNHEADQAQVILQRGRLAHQWEAEIVANALRQQEVLTSQEYEEVTATYRFHGNIAANHLILILITRRKDFFSKLLEILWDHNKKNSVKEMDKEFYLKKMAESGITSKSKNLEDPRVCDNPNEKAFAVNRMRNNSLACDQGSYPTFDEKGLELIKAILCNEETKALKNHKADQAQVNLQRGRLAHQWEADIVANALREQEVLTSQEYEEVIATYRNRGNSAAYRLILTVVTGRKDFFSCWKLLEICWDLNKKNCVKEMDKDFYLSYENNNTKMIKNAKKMGSYNQYHVDTQDDNEPVSSRTRSKTKLRLQEDNKQTNQQQMKDPYKTVLMLPVSDQRQSGAPQKRTETLLAEQVVSQHPISRPSGAIRKYVQGKDAVVQARLQENNKQTQQEVRLVACVCKKLFTSENKLRNHQSTDCQMTFGHDHDKTSPLPSRAHCATFRTSPNILSREYSGDKNERQENKLLSAIKTVKRCTCGRHWMSQEELDRHRSLDCKER